MKKYVFLSLLCVAMIMSFSASALAGEKTVTTASKVESSSEPTEKTVVVCCDGDKAVKCTPDDCTNKGGNKKGCVDLKCCKTDGKSCTGKTATKGCSPEAMKTCAAKCGGHK